MILPLATKAERKNGVACKKTCMSPVCRFQFEVFGTVTFHVWHSVISCRSEKVLRHIDKTRPQCKFQVYQIQEVFWGKLL